MTDEQNERAARVWREACGAYEDNSHDLTLSIRERTIAGDQAAAAIIAADRAELVEARELMPTSPGYWSSLPVDPAAWDKAKGTRLNFDRPEYATAAWLRAWHRYGHWLEDLQTQGEAA